jgi:hypothetical protein
MPRAPRVRGSEEFVIALASGALTMEIAPQASAIGLGEDVHLRTSGRPIS